MSETMDENDAYEAIREFFETRMKSFNYTVIVGLTHVDESNHINSVGFTLSNVDASTPFGIVKSVIANIGTQHKNLADQYEIKPAESLFKEKGGKQND